MSTPRLRRDHARRLALAAQGLDRPRPSGRIDVRHVRAVVRRLDLLQIDAVQTVERAQYVPVFSRLGPYPMRVLDDLAYRRRELFEAWAHEASLVRIERWPDLRYRRDHWVGGRVRQLEAERPGYIAAVYAEVANTGPLTVSELSDGGQRTGPWWGWSPGKTALEALFARGDLAIARRRGQTRVYDVTERVIPDTVRTQEPSDEPTALRRLLLAAARALGVATDDDLIDYHRLRAPVARPLLAELVAEGVLIAVTVDGWDRPTYRWPGARLPRRVDTAALLAPFDPLVWHRPRLQRTFGFRYRLEFYVPAARRVYGYYVMPFLLGDELVARVDVKIDRAVGVLRVAGAWAEPGHDCTKLAGPLLIELAALAEWTGVGGVVVGERGALATAMRAVSRSR